MKKNLEHKNVKLIRKYQVSLLISGIIFVGVLIMLSSRMKGVEQEIAHLAEEDAKVQKITELQRKYLEADGIVAEFLSFGDEATINTYNQLIEEIQSIQADLISGASDNEIKKQIELTKDNTNQLKSIFEDEIVYGVRRKVKVTYIPARSNYRKLNAQVVNSYNQIIEQFNKDKEAANTALYSVLKVTSIVVVISVLGALVIAFVWIYIITSDASKKLKELVKINQEISSKNLNVPKINIKSRDEIGLLSEAVNTMTDTLKTIVYEMTEVSSKLDNKSKHLNVSTAQVGTNSNEINETMHQLASAVSEQAENLNTILQHTDLLTSQIIDTNNQSRELSKASKELFNISTRGNESMQKSIKIMNSIQQIVEHSVEKIKHLEEHSKGISKLVDVISSISEQTNLLALNASIEAARAGEAGRGFAVVAGEIGGLANQVKLSVSDIEKIIKSIQDETKNVAETLNRSNKEVQEGTKQIKSTESEFIEINNEACSIENKAITIDKNLDVIEDSTKNINESLERISAISEETSASVQETLAAVTMQGSSVQEIADNLKELKGLSDELGQMIAEFKV